MVDFTDNNLTWVGHCLVFEHNLNLEQEQCTYKHNFAFWTMHFVKMGWSG
jgi:hypothetical protein